MRTSLPLLATILLLAMCSTGNAMAATATASFTASATTVCTGDSIHFTNTSTGANSAEWWIDGNLFATATNLTWSPQMAGSRTVQLVALGPNCTDTAAVTITVLSTPVVVGGPNQSICPDSAPAVILNASISNALGPYSYVWSPGSGLNDSTVLNPAARPDSTTTYFLVVTAANGCRSRPDTASEVTVVVRSLPVALAGPDTTRCTGDTLTLNGTANGAGPQYFYDWSPISGLSNPNIPNPQAFPSQTTQYTLMVFSNGCASFSDTITVNVANQPGPAASFSVTNPGGSVYQFQDASAGNPVAWSWELTCAGQPAPIVNTNANWSDTLSGCDFEVCLTVGDAIGCGDRFCDSLSVPVGLDNGIEGAIVVYPNPATEWVKVDFSGTGADTAHWKIVDAQGKTVLEGGKMTATGGVIFLNVSSLSPGPYGVLVRMDSRQVARRALLVR